MTNPEEKRRLRGQARECLRRMEDMVIDAVRMNVITDGGVVLQHLYDLLGMQPAVEIDWHRWNDRRERRGFLRHGPVGNRETTTDIAATLDALQSQLSDITIARNATAADSGVNRLRQMIVDFLRHVGVL